MNLICFVLFLLTIELIDSELPPGSCNCNTLTDLQHLHSDTHYRISNGTDANPKDLQYVAVLFSRSFENETQVVYRPFCSGTILNERYILTASHCREAIMKLTQRYRYSFAGAGGDLKFQTIMNYENETNFKLIQRSFFHPEFQRLPNHTTVNDVALVELYEKFTLGPAYNIYAACILPYPKSNVERRDLFIIAGYGRQYPYTDNKHDSSDNDNPVDFDYLEDYYENDYRELPQRYDYKQLLVDSRTKQLKWSFAMPSKCKLIGDRSRYENVVCMRSDYSGGCRGDSGGPLLYPLDNQLYLIGIFNGGFKRGAYRCTKESLDYYTLIDNYMDWIDTYLHGRMCKRTFAKEHKV